MVELHTLEVGACTHPGCLAVKGASWAPARFPARAYLLKSKNEFSLWDTGYSQHFMSTNRLAARAYKWVTPVQYDHPSASLVTQLSTRGIEPADIKAIHISHFHADHFAGLKDFPDAALWASPKALASIQGLGGLNALLKAHLPELLPDDFYRRVRTYSDEQWVSLPPELTPFSHGWSLCDEETLYAVPLPGHAAGHVGVFVKTEKGWTLLAFDACWSHAGYENLVGPSELSFLIQDDRAAYYDTLQKLHSLHLRGVPILLTHA